MLEDEWLEAYGLKLAASGGLGELPRIFDTANPGSNKYGDPDLGSPNEKCTPSGPGTGIGGEPGAPGENCDPLGNVLIIQENNKKPEIPDDNVDGGTITFTFMQTVEYVYAFGIIDVDYESSMTVYTETDAGLSSETIEIEMLGDNSVQTVPISMANVVKLKLDLARSGGVTFLTFCVPGPAPTPGGATPSEMPVMVPTRDSAAQVLLLVKVPLNLQVKVPLNPHLTVQVNLRARARANHQVSLRVLLLRLLLVMLHPNHQASLQANHHGSQVCQYNHRF